MRIKGKEEEELATERRARQEAEAKRQEAEAKLAEALAGKASMKYEAGTIVQLLGVKSEMQYNGQIAEIIRDSPHRGHYEIKTSDVSMKTVRSKNVRPSPTKADEFIIHSGAELRPADVPPVFMMPPKIGMSLSSAMAERCHSGLLSNASVMSIPIEECYSSSDASSVSIFDRPSHVHDARTSTPPLVASMIASVKEKKEKN